MKRIYLDYNASTPIDPCVLQVFIQELEQELGNASSIHFYGQQCRRKLEQSRQIIAHFFKVKPQEIIFTSGGTEGAALLLQGVMLQNRSGHVISSSVEHACVYQTLQEFQKRGYDVSFLRTGEKGSVEPEDVERAIRSDTCLITLMAVNNETGVMTDLEAIAAIAHRRNIPFIVDGVAWLGKEILTLPIGVSALFFSGHKIHAPKGVGFCICKRNLKLTPLFIGGGQEYNKRSGTENLSGIVALAKAVSLLEEGQESMIAHMRKLRNDFERELISRLPHVVMNGSGPRVSNTSNLAFLGVDGETLLLQLDMANIAASHGSACASGALEPSRILLEMGIPLSRVNSSIRFSFGRTTTEREIQEAVSTIVPIVERLRFSPS